MIPKRIPRLIEAFCQRCIPEPHDVPKETSLLQVGEIRLRPQGSWMPFSATQTISVRDTQFLWRSRVRMGPLVTAVVEDGYEHGQGRLDAKIWGFLPIVRGRGTTIDQGEVQRYLAELVWCPWAFQNNDALRFRELGPREIRVWIGDPQTHVDLLLDQGGDILGVKTRARPRAPKLVQPWAGRFSGYRDFGVIRAPSMGEVWWEAPEGRFIYWKGRIVSLEIRD